MECTNDDKWNCKYCRNVESCEANKAGTMERPPTQSGVSDTDRLEWMMCNVSGHEYPQDTPAAGSEVLTDHIKVCNRHPMRKAEADVAMLRAALVGLIGADSEQELRQMEAAMRVLPAPDADKAVSINAIRALLATLPPNAN